MVISVYEEDLLKWGVDEVVGAVEEVEWFVGCITMIFSQGEVNYPKMLSAALIKHKRLIHEVPTCSMVHLWRSSEID